MRLSAAMSENSASTSRTPMRARAYPGEVPESVPPPDRALAPFLYLLGPDSRGVIDRLMVLRRECRLEP